MAPGILMQMSVILTAGFLLGWRGGIVIGLLTIIADFGLVYLEINGLLPTPTVLHNPVTRWVAAIIPFGTIIALQYYATNHLHTGLMAMQREIQKREEAEKIKDQTVYNLGERVKELKTLYSVSRILQDEDASNQKLISKIAEVIPLGWQYPDITAVRVNVNETAYATHNYKPSENSQLAQMKTASGTNVQIEVVYLQSMPDFDEGPFLKEERNLINMLVEMLKIDLERRERRTELRESEEKFRSIVEQSLVGIYIIQNGNLVYVNPGFEKIFGYSKTTLINKMSFEGLVHDDDIEHVLSMYHNRINKSEAEQQYIFKAIRNDGAVLHIEVIASLIVYNNEPAIIGTLVDITDRMEDERRINQAVLDAQENERLQIGMELHDNVKQILAGSGLFLDIAQKKLDDKEEVTKILNHLKKYNTEAITEVRRLSHQLAPLVEEDTTLKEKIEWLIQSLNLDENLSVSVHIDEFKEPLDNNTQLVFYRILQEQLSNILKYAQASLIEMNIRSLNHIIQLQVKDNGKGFDVNAIKGGIGLENIRRRVQMLNGKVEIISFPGKGCEVNVEVPAAINKHSKQ